MKAMIVLLLLLELIFCSQQSPKVYRCGYGIKKSHSTILNKTVEIRNKSSFHSRKLDEVGDDEEKDDLFDEKFNMYFDFEGLKNHYKEYDISDSSFTMLTKAINNAIKTLGNLLNTYPTPNYYLYESDLQGWDIKDWNKTHPLFSEDNSGMAELGIHYIAFGEFDDTLGDDVFASSQSLGSDNTGKRRIIGKLYINSKLNLEREHSERYLTTVILHELTHLLVFDVNYFNNRGWFSQEKDSGNHLHNYCTRFRHNLCHLPYINKINIFILFPYKN